MNRYSLTFFLLMSISNSIYASQFKYYAKIDGIYGFKNICPSEITITPSTPTSAEIITIGDALIPAPTISNSYLLAGSVGMDWDLGYRTEIALLHFPRIDYNYQKDENSDLMQFKYSITSIMANLILQLPEDRFIIPFCNIGAGYSRNYLYDFQTYNKDMEPKTIVNPGERWSFAWQIGAGLTVRLNHNFDLDLGYRHMYFNRLDSGTEETNLLNATPVNTKIIAKNYGIAKSHQIFIAGRIYF